VYLGAFLPSFGGGYVGQRCGCSRPPAEAAHASADRSAEADEEKAELGVIDDEIAALQEQLRSLEGGSGARPKTAKRVEAAPKAKEPLVAAKSAAVAEKKGKTKKGVSDAKIQAGDRVSPASHRPVAAKVGATAAPQETAPKRQKQVGSGEVKVASKAPEVWSGWRTALDTELRSVGGLAPWPQLREALLARRRRCSLAHEGKAEEEKTWQFEALAAIPLHYLSTTSAVVKLPPAA